MYTSTVFDIKHFWLMGRERVLSDLIQALNGGHHCVLIGVPGVGKTWMLRYLSDPRFSPKHVFDQRTGKVVRLEHDPVLFLHLNCNESNNLQDLLGLFRRKLRSTGQALFKGERFSKDFDVREAFDLASQQGVKIISFLDHLDKNWNKLVEEQEPLRDLLIALAQDTSALFIFTGTSKWETIARKSVLGELLGQAILVGPPDESYLEEVIAQLGLPPEQSNKILQNTGAHPEITLSLCNLIKQSIPGSIRWDVKRELTDAGKLYYGEKFEKLDITIQQKILDIWRSLTKDEQTHLIKVVIGTPAEDSSLTKQRLQSMGLLKLGERRIAADYLELYIYEIFMPWWSVGTPKRLFPPPKRIPGLGISSFTLWRILTLLFLGATLVVGLWTGDILLILALLVLDAIFAAQMIRLSFEQ